MQLLIFLIVEEMAVILSAIKKRYIKYIIYVCVREREIYIWMIQFYH